MPTTKHNHNTKLPGRFEELVRVMPPRAIVDDVDHLNAIEMIDRLMASGRLTKGQAIYMETLVQLVQVYESAHFAIETPGGVAALKHLLDENKMNASDLARLLGVHASMGSKLQKGERALTVPHLKKLSARFKVRPGLFMD